MHFDITAKQLSEFLGGTLHGDGSVRVRRVAALEDAEQCDVAVVFDPEHGSVFGPLSMEVVQKSNAGLIIASSRVVPGKSYLLVDDPLAALDKLAATMVHVARGVAQTARIDDTVILEERVSIGEYVCISEYTRVGEGSRIGAHSVIGRQCRFGRGVLVHPRVTILDGTIVGDGSIIHSGAVIGSDGFGYRVFKNGLRKVPQIGGVELGKQVEVGAGTCIDRATFGTTKIGDGVKLDNLVHIAHNVSVGSSTAIIAQTGIAGGVRIGAGCQIGGQVAIKDHITIGNGVKIVSKSGVAKSVQDGEVIAGQPAMPFAKWKRLVVALARLPEVMGQFRAVSRRSPWWKKLFGM